METEKEILDLINQIGPWAQILTLPNGITTPGKWNAKEQALFLMENLM